MAEPANWIAADILRIKDGILVEHSGCTFKTKRRGNSPKVESRCLVTRFLYTFERRNLSAKKTRKIIAKATEFFTVTLRIILAQHFCSLLGYRCLFIASACNADVYNAFQW